MEIEQLFYKIGKVCFFLGAILIFVLKVTDFGILSGLPECAFFSTTGLYCPGCGGTRAVKCLLNGEFVRSFLYHPFVLYCFVSYIIFMTYEFIKKRYKKFKKVFPVEIVIYIGVGILILQWIIRVILQFVL